MICKLWARRLSHEGPELKTIDIIKGMGWVVFRGVHRV